MRYFFNKTSVHVVAFSTVFVFASTTLPALGNNEVPFTEMSLIVEGARISHHKQTNKVNFIGNPSGKTLSLPAMDISQTVSDKALAALNTYGALFGLEDPSSEMTLAKILSGENGRSVVRYQQNYRGLPVMGGELNVNLGSDNGLLSINGEISPRLSFSTKAEITAQQAANTALEGVAKWHHTTPYALDVTSPVLVVYDPQLLGPDTSPVSLVWRMEVTSKELRPIRELVLIDAQHGYVSLHFNQVDTVKHRETYTSGYTSTLPGTLVCNETDPTCAAGTAAGNTDAADAHQFAGDTYDFYFSMHGRDSIDNEGMTIISSVNWDDGYSCPNAFWNGIQMVYCTNLVVDDVVAHELTHGVTDNTSNLFYYYQSGAINESFSDLWGEFVDLTNGTGTDDAASRWLLGEDATIIGGAIRSMSDPTIYGDPDKMSSINYRTDSGDGGGVHTNSGINNKAVYLMVDGGTFNGRTVTGLGIDKVARIYYEVQTNLLTSGSDYLDLYNALYQGCQNLVGIAGITSGDCTQVRTATEAVEMNQEPVTAFNPEAEICPAGTVLTGTAAFFDDMESGLGMWTLTNAGSGQNWVGLYDTYGVSSAASGVESLLGEDVSFTSDQRAAITVALPGGHPYLHFKHAFDFETYLTSYYDGGVMEYSTNGGASWNDAGSLIDAGKSYSGNITTGWGNPLAGRSGFVGASHGYVSSRLNLDALAGQTVKFRWRVGTDYSVSALGWWLDDVRVYACDYPGSLTFSAATYSQSENSVSATITVNRTGGSGGTVSIDYVVNGVSAEEESDFSAASGTLNWVDGDSAPKSFTIPLINDTTDENDETVSLTLSNPTGGASLGTQASATLTITDDDPAPTSGGGGGGALGWAFILLGLLLRLMQRSVIPSGLVARC